MIYSNLEFLLLLPVLVVWHFHLKSRTAQNWLLLLASVAFLAWSNVWNLAPAAIVLATGFIWSQLETRFDFGPRGVFVAIAFLVLQLLYLKYRGFLASAFGVHLAIPAMLAVFIPLGISFYTFEAISAIVDAHRRKFPLQAANWTLFIMFLPHLVAGPIVRWRQLAPQFDNVKRFSQHGFRIGLHLFTIGFLKKLAADPIGQLIDPVWSDPQHATAPDLALALVGFYAQLFLDFSGYTDMGRGVARMLGFRLPVNFRAPFFAHNPSAFYQRWHVSLSSWIRTFVYDTAAVAVFRRVRSRANQNRILFIIIIAVMALFGLWHGSAWHFVLFGVAQGVVIVSWAFFTKGKSPRSRWGWGTSLLLLQLSWLFSLVLFRSDNMALAGNFLAGFFHGALHYDHALLWCLVAVVGTILCQAVDYYITRRPVARTVRFLRASSAGAALMALVLLGAIAVKIAEDLKAIDASGGRKIESSEGFIYFRF